MMEMWCENILRSLGSCVSLLYLRGNFYCIQSAHDSSLWWAWRHEIGTWWGIGGMQINLFERCSNQLSDRVKLVSELPILSCCLPIPHSQPKQAGQKIGVCAWLASLLSGLDCARVWCQRWISYAASFLISEKRKAEVHTWRSWLRLNLAEEEYTASVRFQTERKSCAVNEARYCIWTVW